MKNLAFLLLFIAWIPLTYGKNPEKDSLPVPKMKFIRPVLIGAGGIAAWGLTYRFADTPVRDFMRNNQADVPGFIAEYAEPMGRGRYLMPLNAGIFLTGVVLYDKKLAKAGVAGITACLMNDFVSGKLKSTFERHRPNTGSPYNTFEGPTGSNQNRSLPSSHTSNAFTTATVIASVYKDKKWVPPVAYGLASLVAFSRVYQDHHWASDVLAGAAVGFACGKISVAGWNWLEKKNLLLIPSFGRNKNTVTVLYQF